MCSLIVVFGIDDDFPVLVAGNRDERRDRPSAPPGLYVGAVHRMLSPRDRRAGGTWLAVAETGMVAGLTNVFGAPAPDGATTRGELPHLALDAATLDDAVERVERRVAEHRYGGFQLLLCDGRQAHVIRHVDGELSHVRRDRGPIVISNEHPVDALQLPDLPAALEPGLDVDARLERLRVCLTDAGERSGHRVLKRGGAYGTVSSSLIAVPAGDPRDLRWNFAAGQPDEVPYRRYGNLGRRLVEA